MTLYFLHTGEKPPEVEYCTNQDCSPTTTTGEGGNKPIEVQKEPYVHSTDLVDSTDEQLNGGGGSEGELQRTYNYAWRFTGYGSCSAACMGGINVATHLPPSSPAFPPYLLTPRVQGLCVRLAYSNPPRRNSCTA